MPQVLLSVPPDPAYVRLSRLVVAELARKAGIGDDVLDDIRLAVGQACARAVSVHRHQGLSDPVLIGFDGDHEVEVTVADRAPLPAAEGERAAAVLTENAAPQPWVDEADDADLATVVPEIALLQALAPDLQLTTGPGGSIVCMRWPPQRTTGDN